MIIYSPGLIKRIKTLINNKISYIVAGFPSNDDIKIA